MPPPPPPLIISSALTPIKHQSLLDSYINDSVLVYDKWNHIIEIY